MLELLTAYINAIHAIGRDHADAILRIYTTDGSNDLLMVPPQLYATLIEDWNIASTPLLRIPARQDAIPCVLLQREATREA